MKINIEEKLALFTEHYSPKVVGNVNDMAIKLVKLQGEFIIVPHGVEHRPVAPEEVHLMLIEPASTLNTGTVVNERTVAQLDTI